MSLPRLRSTETALSKRSPARLRCPQRDAQTFLTDALAKVGDGTYAAPVWHAYMLPAHGEYCEDFPLPEEPFVSSPFFGKYASTGNAGTGGYYDQDADPSTDDTTGGTEYDPRYYETAPQDAPDVQVPEEAPTETPEGGDGGGITPGDG